MCCAAKEYEIPACNGITTRRTHANNSAIGFDIFDKVHSLGNTGRITALCVDERVRDMGLEKPLIRNLTRRFPNL